VLCNAAGRSLWCIAESSMSNVSDTTGEGGRYFIIQFLPHLVNCSIIGAITLVSSSSNSSLCEESLMKCYTR